MDSTMLQDIGEIPLKLGISFVLILLAGKFENHFWKLLVIFLQNAISSAGSNKLGIVIHVLTTLIIWLIPRFENFLYMTRQGCVMITGCDSGMGQATVVYLAKTNTDKSGYEQIFAACFNPKASQEAFEKLLTSEEMKFVTVVPLDVTDDKSCKRAADVVDKWIKVRKDKESSKGLVGIIQFHGIAFNGPAAYMPMDMYERQLQVNFFGNLRVVQNFLPIMKKRSSTLGGRIIFTGTGGGSCSPCPPLLTAYMSSKFATEAYCQSLRAELYMTGANIECSVINPGFVKPTMLMEEGNKLTDKMWKSCESSQGSSVAKQEFGPLMDHFVKYSALQPGTHVSEVAKAAEHGLLAKVPRSSYKVGIDSKLAPIVGMMPTGMRETITLHGIYGILSPAGTVKGYRV